MESTAGSAGASFKFKRSEAGLGAVGLSVCEKATPDKAMKHNKNASVKGGEEMRMGSIILGKRAGRELKGFAKILVARNIFSGGIHVAKSQS